MKPVSFTRQPLDEILSGTGSVRVLRTLLAADTSLSVAQVAKATAMTKHGTRTILHDLQLAGMVTSTEADYGALFQPAADHPLLAALTALFDAEQLRFDAIDDALMAATENEWITAAWLVGGQARAEDLIIIITPDPDQVDELAEGVRQALHEKCGRQGTNITVAGLAMADVRKFRAQNAPLWESLIQFGQTIKGPPPPVLCRQLSDLVDSLPEDQWFVGEERHQSAGDENIRQLRADARRQEEA